MARLREQDTRNRGLILRAAFRGKCAYHNRPLSSVDVRTP